MTGESYRSTTTSSDSLNSELDKFLSGKYKEAVNTNTTLRNIKSSKMNSSGQSITRASNRAPAHMIRSGNTTRYPGPGMGGITGAMPATTGTTTTGAPTTNTTKTSLTNTSKGTDSGINNKTKILESPTDVLVKKVTTGFTSSKAIVVLVGLYVLVMVGYLLSSSYRVGTAFNELSKYKDYLIIDNSYLKKREIQEKKLRDFYIATSFRPYLAINQLLDYTSDRLLQKTLMSGARCIYVDVFNSTLGTNSYPVVSSGFEKGNWRLTLNKMSFDKLCQIVSKTVFSSGYVNNYDAPFILMLNLKTSRNYVCLNRIQKVIYKYFKNRLLQSKYSYQKADMGNVKIKELMGKIIIMTSGGYENSSLEELINFSWDGDNLTKISFTSLETETSARKAIKLNIDDVRNYNKSAMTLVVPSETAFFTSNYNPDNFFVSGCQFIAMNYQKVDSNINKYITKFRSSSFVAKPSNLISLE